MFPAPRHLAIQIMRHRAFFMDVAAREAHHGDLGPRRSLPYHVVLLVANLLPVVLLAEPLGKEINYGIEVLNVPTTLGGIVIAVLVLSPEGLTSLQAARRNQLQRSVNLSLGSALSTIGLTIPCMICNSLLDGIPLQLGLAPAEAILAGAHAVHRADDVFGRADQHSVGGRPSCAVCKLHRAHGPPMNHCKARSVGSSAGISHAAPAQPRLGRDQNATRQ